MRWVLVFDLVEAGFQSWWFGLVFLFALAPGLLLLKFQSQLGGFVATWLPFLPKVARGLTIYPKLSDDDLEASVSLIQVMGAASILVAIVAPLPVTYGFYLQYSSLKQAYYSGDYIEVQGIVEEFIPAEECVRSARGGNSDNDQMKHGYPLEGFQVNDSLFVYSDYLITGGFHQSSACGGPIRQGLTVKIWHVDNIIIRLEILNE